MHGQLGDGTTTDQTSFVEVMSSGVLGVAAGFGHSMVLRKDGSVWATGYNIYGQLGDGSMIAKDTYVRVSLSLEGGWWTVLSMSTPMLLNEF